MIDYVIGGQYLLVNSNPGSTPYINTNNPMTGMTRFYNNRLEVYDGNSWQHIGGGSATVNLTSDAINILDWAKDKMKAEREAREMAKTHPGVADLMERVRLAEEQLEAFVILAKKEKENE